MSINMTQAFVFETDDQGAAEKMLATVVPILFRENGEYTKLHIERRKEGKADHRDETDYGEYWRAKAPLLDMGDHVLLAESGRMYHGAVFHVPGKKFKTRDEAAIHVNAEADKVEKHAKWLWLATLADYRGDFKEGNEGCRSHGDMINSAFSILNGAVRQYKPEFRRICGDGYNDWFNSDDGSVGVGYRLWYSPNGGWNKLNIGLCHMYYGK
jgi:hypothetical protein